MKIACKNWIPPFFLFAILFALPFEHKYDKIFRYYSLTLIPENLVLPESFDKKIYFYPSDLIAIALFFIAFWHGKRKEWFARGTVFLGVIFVASLVSIVISPFAGYPVAYIRLWQLFTPMALFTFIACGPLEPGRVIKIAGWSLFATAMMQASIATTQYFQQHSLGLRILSEQRLDSAVPPVPSGKICSLDWGQTLSGIYRSMGTMPHPNVLGGFFTLTLLVTTYLFLAYPKRRRWLAPAYLFQLLALATTFSRSAIYAWVLGTLIYFAWIKFRQKGAVWKMAAVVVVSFTIVGGMFHEQYRYRGGIVNYNECARASDALRLHYQRVALRITEKYPLWGVGYGQFSCRAASFLDEGCDAALADGGVHNIYLRLGAETGIISLAAFLAWIGLLLWAGWRAVPSLETGLLMAAFIAFLLIGCCDHYPILFQQGKLMFFAVAGLLARYGRFEKSATLQNLHAYDR